MIGVDEERQQDLGLLVRSGEAQGSAERAWDWQRPYSGGSGASHVLSSARDENLDRVRDEDIGAPSGSIET